MLKKVLFLTNIPSPYRVDFFNDFGKYVDLTVLFEIETSTERDESWSNFSFDNFHGIIMKGIRTGVDGAFCPEVIKYLGKGYDMIIISNLASATGLLAVRWLKKHHIPYVYEGDGGVARQKRGVKALWKKYIIKDAVKCFSTTKEFDEYCVTYGADKENIVRYPLSSVWEKNILSNVLTVEEKCQKKEKLGITEQKIIVAVGRVIHLKGFDVLLNAIAESGIKEDVGLYIVGGSENEELGQIKCAKELKNVHFIDFILPNELVEYYRAADLFVLPTRYDPWGLVVNEAMAQGLPIITTYQCGAGTELVEGNGYLYSCEDYNDLTKKIDELLTNDKKREEASAVSLRRAREFTIEKMTEVHLQQLGEC